MTWKTALHVLLTTGVLASLICLTLFIRGPFSLKRAYDRDVAGGPPAAAGRITEADLATVPDLVQRYIRRTGFVGQPRPTRVAARMRGRIRTGPAAKWMPFSSQQTNFYSPRTRSFYLDAWMFGLPVQGYHRYVGANATMDIRLLGLVTVQRASGPQATRAETVTLFNDMCLLAPGTLLDPSIVWTPGSGSIVGAAFTNAGHTIRAELEFNDDGDLVNFWSDDRFQMTPEGELKQVRWSTPLGGYRNFGPYRLASGGRALWHEPGGAFAYIELTIDSVSYAEGAP